MRAQERSFGEKLRDWRRQRRLSQLDLACEADLSSRHLSFLETGRSTPSRDMVLRLAERLDVPLRERNALAIPLRLVTEAGTLSLLSTTMVFGTPLDVFISELAVETFLPADAATADTLRTLPLA